MKRIPILFMTDDFSDMAGAERNLYEIVTRLDKNKFTPMVLVLRGGPIIEELKKQGISARNLGLWRTYDLKAFWEGLKLIRLIKVKRIKIVVTYHESSDFWGGIIAKISGVPVIISSRRDMGYQLKKRHFRLYKILNSIFDKIVTVSDAVKQMVFDKESSLWSQLITIHNGVDIGKFSRQTDTSKFRASLGLDINTPVVGMLAVLRPIKGHNYFLQAASIILKRFPETNFLIVGSYDPKSWYYKKLKNMVKELNIEKNVIFAGGRKDTPNIFSALDIFVLSSINEGFPNVILEAMAAGRAIVATSGGGTPEAVIDGKTGILVPSCNPDLLAKGIIRLLEDKKLAGEMGKAGTERVKEQFNIDKMIRENENLYLTLLQAKESQLGLSSKISIKAALRLLAGIYKFVLSSLLYYSGLYILLKKIILRKGAIKIINFHRICNDDFDPLGMNITISNFERQIRYIKANYKLMSLPEMVELLHSKRKIEKNAIVVTFDDGYADFYTNAFPIIKKYKIPAIVFLTAGAIDRNEILWYDLIVEAFRSTKQRYINLSNFHLKNYKLTSRNQRIAASTEIVAAVKHMQCQRRNEIISYIISNLQTDFDNINQGISLLTWGQVKELLDSGILFGSHGMSHSILTTLSDKEVEYEVSESKSIIEARTGANIQIFSYPEGGKNDFNEQIMSIIEKNGYIAACTLISGVTANDASCFALRRYCITEGMFSVMFGNFSERLFETELLGIVKGVRKHKD